jgi:sugar phosphate isomerase/epimerase
MSARVAITTFNIDRFTDMESFLGEYERIGVDRLELNGRVSCRVLEELLPFIDRGVVTVASVHNCCPRLEDPGLPEPELSAPDEGERKRAVGCAQRSIETAWRVGAEAVVVHPGSVSGLEPLERPVIELFRAGRADSGDFATARARCAEERRRLNAPFLEACERSLLELSDFIARRGLAVRLGLETPYHHYGIPLLEEYDRLFDRLGDLPIGLWYDTGHVEAQTGLGFMARNALLARHGERLLGLHLHDCTGLDDHQVPGEGAIDFAVLVPYLRDATLRVLEYGRKIQPLERIVNGIAFLQRSGVL